MRKGKMALAVTSVVLIGALAIGGTLAYFTDTADTMNVITMGHVDIELNEPEFEKNPDNTLHNVTPNQMITKDPIVTIQEGSEDAYVRVMLKIDGEDFLKLKGKEEELLASINANIDRAVWYTDGLKDDGGYYSYYCNRVFSTSESEGTVKDQYLFKQFRIPETWGNEAADLVFNILIKADAIQKDNFAPAVDGNGMITGWYYLNEDGSEPDMAKPIIAEEYK